MVAIFMETERTKPQSVKSYREIRVQNAEAQRQNVVDTALLLLTNEGPEAITVRHVAELLGCSTTVIYSLFGNKDGLADALFVAGLQQLRKMVEEVSLDLDLAAYLTKVGWVYWEFAQTYPHYYSFMFGGALSDFHPSQANVQGITTALHLVEKKVEDAIQQGQIRAKNALKVSRMLWSSLHGVIHLYVTHHFTDHETAKNLYQYTLETLVTALVSL